MLVTALLVGFAEEGMFRGIAVTTFRVNRFSEVKVALWSTVIFGLAHATNLFSEGPKVILQVLVTILAGYLFYLVRRVSGGLLVPALLHGLWDFALLSSYVVEDETYAGALLFILANVVLLAIVIARRHRIEPSTEAAPQPAAV
jgi:membrane protease YdiL (CAAX protease family)